MTLTEFIKQLKEDYNLQKTVAQIEGIVKKHAKAAAVSGVAVIDDDTVKDWIINADNEKEEITNVVSNVKQMLNECDTNVKQMLNENNTEEITNDRHSNSNSKSDSKSDSKEKKEYEQTSLFDLL